MALNDGFERAPQCLVVHLALKAQRFSCRSNEQQQRVCGGDFEAIVKRSDFGMSFGLPLVADTVRLLIQVEGRCTAGC